MPTHTVRQGDCISSIAAGHGLFWKTIWDHPDNSSLKLRRGTPNILLPGDNVFVPDKRLRTESGGTATKHRFRKRGSRALIRMRVLEFDGPRANERYVLEVDGRPFEGTTDGNGALEAKILPQAKKVKLGVGPKGGEDEFELTLGGVDPIDEVSGVQTRLKNLSYDCPLDGKLGTPTKEALKCFQVDEGLEVSGRIDGPTKDALERKHGS